MKRIISILIVLVLCLSFTGCEHAFLSIENLMRPPKISGEDSVLQSAFERTVTEYKDVVMVTPVSGKFRSSYILFDIDNDGEDEAIVLYSVPAENNYIIASIFNFSDEDWIKTSEIIGKSDELYEVNFADVNGDESYEIILSWSGDDILNEDIESNHNFKQSKTLTVYSYDGAEVELVLSETYSNLFFVDLNNKGADEILLFKINYVDTLNHTTFRIISLNDDFSVFYDNETYITDMIEIENIVSDRISISGKTVSRIFVDGNISEKGIITEIIEIDERNFNISLPLYDDNKTLTPKTLRESVDYCFDVDMDGFVEIPTLEEFPYSMKIVNGVQDPINLVVWSSYDSDGFVVKFKSILNSRFGYTFNIPEDFIGKISVIYDEENSNLTFYSINKDGEIINALFSCKNFTIPEWEENNFNYVKLYENDAYVYGYLIFKADNYKIYENYINENFYAF